MSAPSLTLRTVQNEGTGIDISVPRFQEEEAPLGGVSVLYEIAVLTKLDLFKTRLHRNEDVVQFSVFKAYREVEDLFNKLNKKYPKAGLPSIPKFSSIDKYTSEEKVAALDRFMQAVAKDIEVCLSSTFTHFIGINSNRLPSFSAQDVNLSTVDLKSEAVEEPIKQKVSEDSPDFFPKVKNVVSKPEVEPDKSVPLTKKNIDLFEEVKLVKETGKNPEVKKGTSSGGLFDDFEDDNLFSTEATPKPAPLPKKEEKKEEKPAEIKQKTKESKKKLEEIAIDDSEIIIKNRKLGNISLFQEQDLGDHINKDEEALFLLSTNKNEKSNKNNLLFSGGLDIDEPDSELHEDLDDLLNLNPLPTSAAAKKPILDKEPEVKQKDEKYTADNDDMQHQPKRPVPLPRKKSLVKSDADEETTMTKPEVMPRKVFPTKPEVPKKPVSAAQEVKRPEKPPPISTKPALPRKPKPPRAPKPTINKDAKNLDEINANQPPKLENQNTASAVVDDLNQLDILKYIEQEQKTFESEPSLFD